MSNVLKLKAECSACSSNSDLYGSNCKHKTLCFKCAEEFKLMFRVRFEIRSIMFVVLARPTIGATSLVNSLNGFKWSLRKDPKHQGMLKKAPWVLEDETGKDMKTLLLAANIKLNESDGMKIDDLVDERKTSVKKEIRISIPKSNRRKNVVRTETTTLTPSATTAKVPVTEEEVRAALSKNLVLGSRQEL